MDAEHRHELKTNELAAWIGDLPDTIKKNLNFIIGLILIVIGLLTWPMLSRMAKTRDIAEQTTITENIQMLEQDAVNAVIKNEKDAQARQQALDLLLVNADALLAKADKLDSPNLAALAQIKAAQTIRTELQLRKQEVPAETIEAQIKKAQDAYQKAFSQAKDPEIKGMAQLGLGLCSEELGQTDQASQVYQDILKNESYAATVVPAQAQDRLDVLKEKIEKVYFAPAPVETPAAADTNAPAPAAGPAIESAPVIEPAPAERQSQAEAQEAPIAPAQQPAQPPAVPQAPVAPQAPAAPQPAPAEQNPAPNE
ncbi:MAG: hypothetical protein LLF76_13995 [Planctomycetaceae bacterium]|nr:hypothetical protein [Planctomycetaceae bacterium]